MDRAPFGDISQKPLACSIQFGFLAENRSFISIRLRRIVQAAAERMDGQQIRNAFLYSLDNG